MNSRHGVIVVFALLVLCAPSQAQSILEVGSTAPFGSIPLAVDAAADGDIILVEDGFISVGSVVVDGKSVTIVADGTASSWLIFTTVATPLLTVCNLASDQRVVVRGIDFVAAIGDPVTGVFVDDCEGPILLEDCNVTPSPGICLLVRNSASVSANQCLFASAGEFGVPGMRVDDSHVFLHDTTVRGTTGNDAIDEIFVSLPPVSGGDGAWIFGDSEVFMSGGSISGGSGGSGTTSCHVGQPAGDGLRMDSTASGSPTVRLRDVAVTAGVPGNGSCGNPDGAPGQDLVILAGALMPLAGTSRAFSMTSPTVVGDDVTLSFRGEPGDLAVLWFAPDIMPSIYFPASEAVLALSLPFADIPFVNLPASGELDIDVTVPALPFGLDAIDLFAQGAFTSSGGTPYLSGPSPATLLAP